MRENRDGRDDGGKKVHGVFGKKIQPQVTILKRKKFKGIEESECINFDIICTVLYRYIAKAGDVGCFGWRYPSAVKQAELRWAEKGPRRKGERPPQPPRGYGGITNSMTFATPSSPWPPTPSPTSVDLSTIYSSRFAVMSSPLSSPAHRHHIPF